MLNKSEAARLYHISKDRYKEEMTHFIIATDGWEPFYICRAVLKGQTVKEVKAEIKGHGSGVKILAIFNCDLPFTEQLREDFPMHEEPSKKFLTTFERALLYATEKHDGQTRKGRIKKPYIEHPKEVAQLVDKYMEDTPSKEKYKVAAILHDTLEDTTATYPAEVSLFGKEIADIVQDLTSDKEKQKEMGKDTYLTDKLLHLPDDTLTVKLCDRLSNIRDLSITDDMNFKEKYMQETAHILNNLVLCRKLTSTHLTILNDIGLTLKRVADNTNDVTFGVSKKPLTFKYNPQENK